MYIINISVNPDLSEQQHQELFPQHAAWFKKYFEAGEFLLVGPFVDTNTPSGVIIADIADRASLDKILVEDVYYPNLAHYEIREFNAKMVANFLAK